MGKLNKARCIKNDTHIHSWTNDLDETHQCPDCGSQMRPHICWFGEMPFQMDEIHQKAKQCDLFVSIGTSGEVYPAAGFVSLFIELYIETVVLNL